MASSTNSEGSHYATFQICPLLQPFFFFFWHYNSWRTLASSKIVLHCSWSCDLHLQSLTPIFFRSSSTDSSHINLGFPTHRVRSGLSIVRFLQRSSSCILQTCLSHLNLPIFITLSMSSSSWNVQGSLLYLVPHIPLSLIGP
jgi:hypothetical protein